MICCLPSHSQMCSNCWKLQKKKIQEDQDQQEGGGEESLVLQEEDQLLTMQLPLSLWYSTKNLWTHICTTWENIYLSILTRTPQLVCILCTLKTKPNVRSILVINIPKPNGCLDRSASRANHCEDQPDQTSDSLFSISIWHTTILYNSRRPMLR